MDKVPSIKKLALPNVEFRIITLVGSLCGGIGVR
jgi:hypothetical protein